MKNSIWNLVFRRNNDLRFKKIFERMEAKGCDLYLKGIPVTPSEQRQVRNYIKNMEKLHKLYTKFTECQN